MIPNSQFDLSGFDRTGFDIIDRGVEGGTKEPNFISGSSFSLWMSQSNPLSLVSESHFSVLRPGDIFSELAFGSVCSYNIDFKLENHEIFESECSFDVKNTFLSVPVEFDAESLLSLSPPKLIYDLKNYRWISATVSKSASNPIGSLTIQIDGTSVPPSGSNMNIVVSDHTGTDRCIFCGVVFDPKYYIQAGRRYVQVTGYEYGFYLTNQSLTNQDYIFSEDYNPDDIVTYWLNGENEKWWHVTGIKPYKVLNPASWGHSYTPKEFVFKASYSKADGIDEIAEYTNMVFLIQTGYDGDNYCPFAYMVHVDDVDDVTAGLDLPEMATFRWPDPYIVDINLATKTSEKINRVIVRGTDDSGVTFEYVKEHPRVTIGEMLPIELLEESKDYADSDLVESRAIELYNRYATNAVTVEATLSDRVDLKLYQLVKFCDFPDIPDDTMRIISISYELAAASKKVKITATSNIDIYNIKGLERSQSADPVAEIETIASYTIAKEAAKPEVGEVSSIDGSTGTVDLERGGTVTVRFLE